MEFGDPPAVSGVLARRYRCQGCGAVIVVVPRSVVGRRLYSAGAIALALAAWAVNGQTPTAVRGRVSPHRLVGPTAASGWASLRRWARAVRAGRLFPVVRASPESATLRQVAARAAMTLVAAAGGGADESAAFLGASM